MQEQEHSLLGYCHRERYCNYYSGLPCYVLKYYSRDDTLEKTYGCESDEVKAWIGSNGDCKDATGVFGPGKDAGEGVRVTICSCGGNYCNKVTTMKSPEPALFLMPGFLPK